MKPLALNSHFPRTHILEIRLTSLALQRAVITRMDRVRLSLGLTTWVKTRSPRWRKVISMPFGPSASITEPTLALAIPVPGTFSHFHMDTPVLQVLESFTEHVSSPQSLSPYLFFLHKLLYDLCSDRLPNTLSLHGLGGWNIKVSIVPSIFHFLPQHF